MSQARWCQSDCAGTHGSKLASLLAIRLALSSPHPHFAPPLSNFIAHLPKVFPVPTFISNTVVCAPPRTKVCPSICSPHCNFCSDQNPPPTLLLTSYYYTSFYPLPTLGSLLDPQATGHHSINFRPRFLFASRFSTFLPCPAPPCLHPCLRISPTSTYTHQWFPHHWLAPKPWRLNRTLSFHQLNGILSISTPERMSSC
jgi:hypothetical protein